MLLYIETYTSLLPTDRITYCQTDGALKKTHHELQTDLIFFSVNFDSADQQWHYFRA